MIGLMHPHIMRVLDFGLYDDRIPFIVMDYAPNGSLRERHPKGSSLPIPTIVNYVKQIASALQYAHENKYIHCDVNPGNILLGKSSELLLSDFGIAAIALSTRSQEQQREKQELVGSWEYAAPEQFIDKAVRASDQYSLAVVVYEWLCGERPFHGNFDQLVVQHYDLKSPPPLLHEKMSISSAVEQVIMKALAKEPKGRFALVTDFAAALEEASAFETVLQKQKVSAAPSSTQDTISSTVQPAQPPITQTILAGLTRRYADGAASMVPSPTHQVTQPVVPRSRVAKTAAAIRAAPTPRPVVLRKSRPHTPTRRPLLRNIGLLLRILIDALEELAQKFGYLGNRGVLLVILILVIGLPGYFAFRNEIIAINSSFSGNASDLTPQQPITSVLIYKTVRFAGVDITIATAQQSKMFQDDLNAGTTGVVRVNLKEDNTSKSSAKYPYSDEAHLILPDKTSVAPANERYFSGPDAGVTRINWLDFPVPKSFQISQLTLQLGRDTETQEIIPLKGRKV
jgi:serine/threonine protein kinase